MSAFVRYGMVGGGLNSFIGKVHREAIGLDPRASLAAGCFSRDPAVNRASAETYGVAPDRIYETYRDMAEAERGRLDFVSVTTANDTHYEITKTFLKNGIHVLCEKPLCFTVAQAEELLALLEEKGLILAVAYAYTGYTMVKLMRNMIADGAIGHILSVNAEYPQEWLIDELYAGGAATAKLSGWRSEPAVSGISNCVGDIGTHIENMVHYLTGLNITRLLATVNRFGQKLELNANILVEYDNGANGAYWCSQVAIGKLNPLIVRIFGEKGSLEWNQEDQDTVRYTPKGQPTQLLSRGAGYIDAKVGAFSRLPQGHPEGLHIAFANMYRMFIDALLQKKTGHPVPPEALDFSTAKEGLAGMKFVHAVIESAAQDAAWIDLR